MITLVAPTHTRQGASSGFCSMQQSCSWDFPLFSSFFQILDMFWEWLWGDSVGLDRNKQNRVSRELSDSIMWGIKMRKRNGNICIYRESDQPGIIQRRLHYVTLYCALVVTLPPLLRNFLFLHDLYSVDAYYSQMFLIHFFLYYFLVQALRRARWAPQMAPALSHTQL